MDITLAFDYIPAEKDKDDFISVYNTLRKETTSASMVAYNIMADRVKSENDYDEKYILGELKKMNGFDHLDTAFRHGIYVEMNQLVKSRKEIVFEFTDEQKQCCNAEELLKLREKQERHRYSVVFGGRKNFIAYQQDKMSKDEFMELKQRDIYIVGQKNVFGNRKFHINKDCQSVSFNPNRKQHYDLILTGIGDNRQPVMDMLYDLQQKNDVALTFRLSPNKIYITFDVNDVYKEIIRYFPKSNVVTSIDMNPNYTGYSIALWISESDFIILETGLYSYKDITTQWIKSSDKDEKSRLGRKLDNELIEVSKKLVNKAIYYKSQIFSVEKLDMKSGNKNKGSYYNTLCNNLFHRNILVNNLHKRCNQAGIEFLQVVAAYSSFVGNLLYRNMVDAPDPVLAAVEIGRRGYEYYNQYKLKSKPAQKNIKFPRFELFKSQLDQSLEELSVGLRTKDWDELYKHIKNAKLVYRVPVDDYLKQSSDFKSRKSMIRQVLLHCSSCT